jgi:signal transduction histidine kinase
LLDLSRFGSGLITLRPERVEVAALIEAALETVQHLFDAKSHQLTLRLPDEPVLLEVDRLRTTQVLINLLTNAAKYTEPGGHLRLEAAPTDAHMRIDVIDNGIGLAAESLNGIFDMFTQVRSTSQRSGGGLGIGLTLAKRLVEMQGGQIEVFSEGLGQGSTFSVTLPLAASP